MNLLPLLAPEKPFQIECVDGRVALVVEIIPKICDSVGAPVHKASKPRSQRILSNNGQKELLPRAPSRYILWILFKLAPDDAIELVKGSETLQVQGSLVNLLINCLDLQDTLRVASDSTLLLAKLALHAIQERFNLQRKIPEACLSTSKAAA